MDRLLARFLWRVWLRASPLRCYWWVVLSWWKTPALERVSGFRPSARSVHSHMPCSGLLRVAGYDKCCRLAGPAAAVRAACFRSGRDQHYLVPLLHDSVRQEPVSIHANDVHSPTAARTCRLTRQCGVQNTCLEISTRRTQVDIINVE